MLTSRAYRWGLLSVIAGAAMVYLLGNNRVPLWDRDEPRYAECSREMLQSGDWVVPRFLGDLRPHKPPFVYWCQATAMMLLGDTADAAEAARLPSVLAVLITAMLLAAWTRRATDSAHAICAALIFSTSILVIAAAKLCLTDGLLLLWICIGQGALYAMWRNPRPSIFVALIFWLSTGLAGLTKGPVVLAVHLGTLLTLAFLETKGHRRSLPAWKSAIAWWRRLRPIGGVVIVILVVAPWLVLVHQRAPGFLSQMLNRAGRYASSGAEGHAAPPGYYLLLIWGLFFPWSIFLPAAIGTAVKDLKDHPPARFALAAAIGPWLVMELLLNKLPLYVLPCFPALAFLTAVVIIRKGLASIAVFGGGAVAVTIAFLFGVVLPNISVLSASRTIGRDLNRMGAGGGATVAMIDYREPSLAFYQGGGAREIGPAALGSPDAPEWVVMTTDGWTHVPQSVRERYQPADSPVPVLVYNDGWHRADLIILRKEQ
jgi:4-amino-4-deoxy-L-arabinose transferase-like glycosyltransferase